MSETQSTALAIVMPALGETICSLPLVTKEDKIKVFNALNNPDDSFDQHIGEEIVITDVILQGREGTTQEGEIFQGAMTTLITADGKVFGGVSIGIAKSVVALCMAFGPPSEWGAGMRVKIVKDGKVLKLMAL